MIRFAGQTVFVTGGNKGIGRGIATRFAEEGAKVAMAAIEADTPEAAAAFAAQTGAATQRLALDVTDAAAVKAAYAEIEAKLGPLSVSVQNAGVSTFAKMEDLTEREWDLNLDLNTKGVSLLPGGGASLSCQRHQGAARQHRLRPGAPGLHLHPALRRLEVRRRRPHREPCQGTRT